MIRRSNNSNAAINYKSEIILFPCEETRRNNAAQRNKRSNNRNRYDNQVNEIYIYVLCSLYAPNEQGNVHFYFFANRPM